MPKFKIQARKVLYTEIKEFTVEADDSEAAWELFENSDLPDTLTDIKDSELEFCYMGELNED